MCGCVFLNSINSHYHSKLLKYLKTAQLMINEIMARIIWWWWNFCETSNGLEEKDEMKIYSCIMEFFRPLISVNIFMFFLFIFPELCLSRQQNYFLNLLILHILSLLISFSCDFSCFSTKKRLKTMMKFFINQFMQSIENMFQ